jgi:hypothetical protein
MHPPTPPPNPSPDAIDTILPAQNGTILLTKEIFTGQGASLPAKERWGTPCAHHTSHITRHTSHVTHHTSHITHHTSNITHQTSHITHHTSHITHHTSNITHQTSHITHHSSHITHHTSHITHHTSHNTHHLTELPILIATPAKQFSFSCECNCVSLTCHNLGKTHCQKDNGNGCG